MSAAGSTPVLQLDDVWLPSPDQDDVGITVDVSVSAGDLLLVQTGDEQHEQLLADVACGLVLPERGTVRFLGRSWSQTPADQANALRGRIGHVLRRGAWLPYLSLLDNVLLPQLHHTRRRYPELLPKRCAGRPGSDWLGYRPGGPQTCRRRSWSGPPASGRSSERRR